MGEKYPFCFVPQELEDDLVIARRRLRIAHNVARYLSGKTLSGKVSISIQEFLSAVFTACSWNLTLSDVVAIGECFGFDPYTVHRTVLRFVRANRLSITLDYRLERRQRE